MSKNTEQSKAVTLTPQRVPKYLEGSKPMNDLVGQAFVAFTKRPKQKPKNSLDSSEIQHKEQ